MADDGLFARNEAGQPLVLEASGVAGQRRPRPGSRRASSAKRRWPTAGGRFRCSSWWPSATSTRAMRPRLVAETCGVPAATIRRLAAEIARTAFEEEIELPVAWTDWAGPTARIDARPPGLAARDARHFGAFERLPDLPRLASAADADRHDRCAGRLALQVAAPKTVPAGPEADRQARPGDARSAAARHPARLPDVARGSDPRRRRAARRASTRRFHGRRRSPPTA